MKLNNHTSKFGLAISPHQETGNKDVNSVSVQSESVTKLNEENSIETIETLVNKQDSLPSLNIVPQVLHKRAGNQRGLNRGAIKF